jgi:hypothetical protein
MVTCLLALAMRLRKFFAILLSYVRVTYLIKMSRRSAILRRCDLSSCQHYCAEVVRLVEI